MTSNRSGLERSRKREPPGAEPARGLCAGDRGPGPEVRTLTGKRLPTPAKREPKCYSALEVQPCGTGPSVYSEPDN